MDTIHQIEIGLILWFQSLGSWLALPFKAITALGYEEFYMLVMPALFWCLDATLGFRVAVMLLLSNVFSDFFKLSLHQPRPYWLDTQVKAYTAETSFGIPSGHALSAMTNWGILAASVRKGWVKIVIGLVIFLIGISRLFLGMHFITDVLAGWLIGGVVLWGFLKVEKRLGAWLRGRTLNQMALLSLGSALVMIILVLIPRALLNGFVVPEIWKQNALAAYPGNVITPVSFEGVFTIAGTWFGMTLGLAWMYHRQGGFRADGTLRQRALRYLVGIAGVLIFWYGLGMVLPREANALSYSLRFTRYALVGLWVAALAPLLFQRMGLSAQPEPLPSLSTGENHL